MRRLELFLIPVLLVTASLALGQEPSANKLQGRPKKISGDWASAPTAAGPIIIQTGAVTEGVPVAPMPGPMVQGTGNAPVHGTSMGQCGNGSCGMATCGNSACGSTCSSCGHSCCLGRIKEWFCSRPIRACDKQVCYDPIPPLYQFFPACRSGYCPRLAPPTCCPQPVCLTRPACQTCRTSECKTSCGTTSSCDSSASCGSCSSCGSSRSGWGRLFGSLRGSCRTCTPSAECFTNGQATGGCATGNCGPK